LRLDSKAYNLVFHLLTKIGSGLVVFEISCGKVWFVSLVNLLKQTPNITKLCLSQIQITPKTISSHQIKLVNLKTIEICRSSSIEIFEKLIKPNSLNGLKISGAESKDSGNFTEQDYRCIPRILEKQQKLFSLELAGILIIGFPESPNWSWKNLQKLVLNKVQFPNPLDFKNFAGLLKTLDKLTDLSLIIESEKTYLNGYAVLDKNQRKFVEMLTELFSLPKLIKLEFEFYHEIQLSKLVNLKVENPGVEELTLEKIPVLGNNNYSQFMKIFPNVRKAKLGFQLSEYNFFILREPDLTPINSWASLAELELNHVTDNMLRQIKNRQKSCGILQLLDCFGQNNLQFERLEINSGNFYYNKIPIVVETLPNLKALLLKTIWVGNAPRRNGGQNELEIR
jgi:hypothetical protein